MTTFDMSSLGRREIYKLLVGSVIPRPIAWVSAVSRSGVRNIAPFSFFNIASAYPPVLGFSVAGDEGADGPSRSQDKPRRPMKDTLAAVLESREYVINIASVELLDKLVLTAIEWDTDTDEFEMAGLTPVPSTSVSAPRIGEAPVSFECRLRSAVELGTYILVLGDVACAHVRDELVEEGRILTSVLQPLGRMPGPTFCTNLNVVPRNARLRDAEQNVASVEWSPPESA